MWIYFYSQVVIFFTFSIRFNFHLESIYWFGTIKTAVQLGRCLLFCCSFAFTIAINKSIQRSINKWSACNAVNQLLLVVTTTMVMTFQHDSIEHITRDLCTFLTCLLDTHLKEVHLNGRIKAPTSTIKQRAQLMAQIKCELTFGCCFFFPISVGWIIIRTQMKNSSEKENNQKHDKFITPKYQLLSATCESRYW